MGNIFIKNGTKDLINCPHIDKDRTFLYEVERNEDQLDKDSRNKMNSQKHMFV